MPPGAEVDEEKAIELINDRDGGYLFRSRSSPATFENSYPQPATSGSPHPLARQTETRDLRYDPISLKEPEDLHSWNWLGCPSRFISFVLHKSVQEVDGRDQHCALVFWLFILLGFCAYGAFLFAGPIQQRKNPPQSFGFLDHPHDLVPISHLPYMMICPQVNWTGIKPDLGAVTQIMVSSRGWVTTDPARVDVKGIHRSSFEDWDLSPADASQCDVKGCYYFDGPTYSASPNESMALDTRWISFTTTVRIPEAKKDDWAVMNALIYAGVETPQTACLSTHVKPFMSVMPLTRRTADHREFGMERVRLKFIENIKLKRRYHLLQKHSTYHKDYFEMNHVGSDVAFKAWNETQEKDTPGYVTFAGSVSYRIAPMIVLYKELEPVNILTILCAIAGIWTAFVVVFKILFPSHNSGRRRVIRALRPWVSRIMPRKKSEAMQSLVRVLPPEEQQQYYSPFCSPQKSRVKFMSAAAGEDEGFTDAKETEEGMREAEAAEELKSGEAGREAAQAGRPRRFSVFRRGESRGGPGASGEYYGPDERLVSLELPGPEERLHEVEQTMKLMVAELHYLRQRAYPSPTRVRPGGNGNSNHILQPSEHEAAESRANMPQLQRFRSLPTTSP